MRFRPVLTLLGFLLVIGAFGVFLFAGKVFNPPPYQIMVAVVDIRPGDEITPDKLIMDEQRMDPGVVQRYVRAEELERYLGAVALETIYTGENLTKLRLATADNSLARQYRFAATVEDPEQVVMVLPVDSQTCPGKIVPGDYVNLVFGAGNQQRLSNLPDEEQRTSSESSSFPPPATGEQPAAGTGSSLVEDNIVLPFAKTVLYRVPILNIVHTQIPNPNYGMPGQEGQQQQPAFLEGDVEALVIQVPAGEQEMLAFAINNGTIHVALLSGVAGEVDKAPLPGITWADVVDRLLSERGIAPTYSLTDTFAAYLGVSSTLTASLAISPADGGGVGGGFWLPVTDTDSVVWPGSGE
jgi:hypothetical protein